MLWYKSNQICRRPVLSTMKILNVYGNQEKKTPKDGKIIHDHDWKNCHYQMFILPKAIYRTNIIPNKIPKTIFLDLVKKKIMLL